MTMTADMETSRLKMKGEVAVITIDSPPVNALSLEMRQGLMGALQEALANPAAKAIVLLCAGRTFIAGADIQELDSPIEQAPRTADIIEAIEAATKPVVAAIHGTALGRGFEVALACHYRVAVPTAKCGLPQIKLGLLPGAGGTQRLTRVVGPEQALELLLSGESLSAQACLELGLIDELITEFDFHDDAINFARKLIAERRPLRRLRDRDEKVLAARGHAEIFAQARERNARQFRGSHAAEHIVQAVAAAVNLPFEEGLRLESQLFQALRASPESAALRHVFFAEREVWKIPDVGGHTPILAINKVGVVGAGVMGSGIATCFADAGLTVKLADISTEAVERALAAIRHNYESNVRSQRLDLATIEKRLGLIKPASLPELADCDLIIEAVLENMDVKKGVFRQLDTIAKSNAILATTTSALNIDEIASAVQRPESVIGLHFFSSPHITRLVEVVRAEKTSKAVIATSMQLAKRLGKIGVLVGVAPGFVGQRMMAAGQAQIEELVREGISSADIQRALAEFRLPPSPRTEQLAVHAVLPNVRVVSDQDIRDRTLDALVNEGTKILREGKAIRASDIDMVWVHGYGWPAYRGGPMFHAESDA